ncbi:hypothetical protein BH11MYX3_BH11MYX3_09260 [soil metagenome]
MRIQAGTLLVIAVLGCKSSNKSPERFGGKRTSTVEVDGFVVAIPAGYRTIDELLDHDFMRRVEDNAPLDSTVLVPEAEPDQLWVSLKAYPSPLEATQEACDRSAKAAGGSVSAAVVPRKLRTTSLGPACAYSLTSNDHDQITFELPHNGKQLLLVCGSYGADGHAKRDAACDAFLGAVRAAP